MTTTVKTGGELQSSHQVLLESHCGIEPLLRRFLLKLCVSITIGIILLGTGELLAFLYLRFDPFGQSPAAAADADLRRQGLSNKYIEELQASGSLQYFSYIVWRRGLYHGDLIGIDKQGLRRTFHSYCDGNAFTIWIFGDSTLWGTGSTDWETIPSRLAEKYENAGQKVCIRNFGEHGWVSTQEVIELMLELKRATRTPDLVIFYDGTDDAFLAYQAGSHDVHQNFEDFRDRFERSRTEKKPGFTYLRLTNTYRLLQQFAMQLEPPRPRHPLSAAEVSSLAGWAVENYEKNMDIVDSLAAQYGFRDLFFWHPTSWAGHKPLTAAERNEQLLWDKDPNVSRVFHKTYELCGALKRKNLFYLGDILDGHQERIYFDNTHLNPEGNRLVAQYLFQVLQSQKEMKQ